MAQVANIIEVVTKMNIREQEDKLFDKWEVEQNRPDFARDGVVSEAGYLGSDLKIVCILKEVNDPGGGDSDLRKYLQEGAPGGGSTWNNIARWVHGVQNRNKQLDWKDFEWVSDEFRKKELQNICAMNLKKSPGGASADMELLREVAKKDKDFIKRQYGFYDPEITLCCGTDIEWIFKVEVLGHDDQKWKWKQTSRGVWWYQRESGKYVIKTNHPQQYSVRSSLLFYELVDAVNEIYGKD